MAEASAGQGFGHRPLGDDGHRARPAVSDVSRRVSAADRSPSSSGASAAARSATWWPPAPRSSTGSAPSTCGPASRSSTPRPTACFRLPRTKTSSRLPSCTASARSPSISSARGLGVGRVIARPFVGAPGAFTRTANRHDYALEPTGDDAARPPDARGIAGGRRSARSATCSPAAASAAPMPHGERRRRHGPSSTTAMARDRTAV